MGWFKKKRVNEEDLVKKAAKKSLNKLKKEKFSQSSFEKLNEILRDFLKEKYNIKQSLTIEELRGKIKSKKIKKEVKTDLMALLLKIYYIEYNKPDPTKKDFNELFNKTKSFLRNMDKE